MLKKVGFVAATAAASLLMLGGVASAGEGHDRDTGPVQDSNEQTALVNLNNTELLHNVNIDLGLCENNINIIAIQAYLRDVANNLGIPILSTTHNQSTDQDPHNCSSSSLVDGGSSQNN